MNSPTSVRKTDDEAGMSTAGRNIGTASMQRAFANQVEPIMGVLRASSVKTSFLSVTLVLRLWTYVAQMVAPD